MRQMLTIASYDFRNVEGGGHGCKNLLRVSIERENLGAETHQGEDYHSVIPSKGAGDPDASIDSKGDEYEG